MTRNVALFLIVIGLLLDLAVKTTLSGLDLHAAGLILLLVGVVAFLYSLIVER